MTLPQQPHDPKRTVLHWNANGVAHIRFNRPQALNAIDMTMAEAFQAACQAIAQDAAVRVVLLSAEGRAFMAGGDLAQMREDPVPVARSLIDGMHAGLRHLAAIDAPVIAAVHGAVAGGGLGLVLGCDLVVAAEGTRFSVAYPLVGTSCDCGTSWALPRIVGLRKAMELAMLGESFDAAQALQMGIVNRVAARDSLEADALAMAEKIASGPTRAFGHLKRLMRQSLHTDLPTQLDAEAQAFAACAATDDFAEGLGAFLDKRAPRFTGH